MLKFAALTLDSASRKPKRALALTMLSQFSSDLSEADEAILHRLYCTIRLANGGHMKTFRNRYRELDNEIADEIERRFPGGQPVSVHYMGASNAVTSLELFHRLRSREKLTLRASDYHDALAVVTVPKTGWQVVFDNEKRALQFVGWRMAISITDEPRKYPMNLALRGVLMRTILPRASQILDSGGGTRIETWHPLAKQAAATDRRFSLGRDDVFNPGPETYSILRILNVCHRFPRSTLPAMFSAIAKTIIPGGVLVVGFRPMQDPLDASFFERTADGFALIRDIGKGFSDKDVVLNARH